jgi:hypothetical protein
VDDNGYYRSDMMRQPLVRALVLGVLVVSATAMLSAGQLQAPAGWKWVTDSNAKLVTTLDPAEGSWLFATMAPGWHVTTRPGAIVFQPEYTNRGRFVLESESFLFPGTSPAGFGVFVGGSDLEGRARYVAFLIRRDGSAAVESVEAGRVTALHPWTKNAAVVAGTADGDVKNVLRVEGEAALVTFLVNGQKVAEVPRDGTRFDGTVGLRVGENLNLHVTNLDLTHRLALPRKTKQP